MADPFSAWGAEAAPDRLIQRDNLEKLRIGVAAQEALGRIAMQPDQARVLRAKANVLEQEAEAEKTAAELMRRAMGGGGAATGLDDMDAASERPSLSMADRFDNAAEVFAGSGLVTKAQKLAETAATIRQREASAISSAASARLNQLKFVREAAEGQAQMFGGATDEASWDAANRLYEFQTGAKSPFQGVPYNPEMVEGINQRALTAKERYDLEEKALTRRSTAEYRKSRLKQFDTENDIREERARLAREREERITKQQGKTGAGRLPSAEAKDKEIAQVKNLIRRDFPMAGDFAGELNNAAFTIASEARAKMRANPALSPSAAINQAYTEAVKFGDIEADKGTAFGLVGKKFRFAGGGRSPETAMTLPTKAAEAKVGRYYMNASGQVAKWDGKRFVPVEVTGDNRRPLSNDNGRLDEED